MSSNDNFYKDFQEKSSGKILVDKLTKEIEANLNNEQFGVDSLAQSVGMSRSNLHRKLNKLLNTSTSRFIREYRLKRALEILKQEDITASEVAYRIGFSSATYFNTSFHKFYGYTPGDVKSRISREIEQSTQQFTNKNEKKLSIDSGSSKTTKSKNKKTVLWVTLLLVIIASALFFFNDISKKEESILGVEKTTHEKSIAVLPFKNLTGKPDLEYVSDGMTDAVISRLTKVSAIGKVIPFTSTLSYKKTKKTIKEIATELNVSTLLQGNLQISGNRIKISLQLIDATTSEHIWSEEYARDWKSDEIFGLQTELVEGIASNMNSVIAKDELADIKKTPTKSKLAYSYYLQGEFQRQKGNELSYLNAISLYEKAITVDSNFVDPYIDMANVWNMGGSVWGFYDEQIAWGNAMALLEKALKIEPTNQRVEEELNTGSFFYDWNFELVEKFYQNILGNSIHDKPSVISLDYPIKTGRPEETLKAIEYYIINDPSNVFYPFFKAEAMFYLGSTDEANEILTQTDPLYKDNWFYLRESTKLYFYLEEYEKSKIQLKKILNQFSDYPPILMWLNAVYAQMDGNSNEVIQYLGELQNEYDKGSSGSPAWFIALYYAHIKDYERTFEWLQKSYDRHEVEMTWLREEPLLAPVRNDPQYKELYEKVGFSSIGLPIKSTSDF
ncbi:TolB amino-terminal domain-containing protein [Maribacter dokdonensis]|uniref:TolB amino-terminal domain-containing protein n=1 Tax=Maribacter dokdonensis TaxID=320912 RepID=A0A1H4US04_9FLAO|nr:helix-turn-helix domain-containing protein [Maribacter dokdonensis]SEC71051.1 TolB amino-terminal domain-containing protein [Maribacter dokdonensis]